jgi:arylsulfatase A-like enzyme
LARDGVLFEHLVAQSSWTRPATASILTGVYPRRHGAITLENAIAPEVSTLAELLRAAGYRTAGFVSNVNVADRFGFGRGFEVYRYLRENVSRRHLAHAAGSRGAPLSRRPCRRARLHLPARDGPAWTVHAVGREPAPARNDR